MIRFSRRTPTPGRPRRWTALFLVGMLGISGVSGARVIPVRPAGSGQLPFQDALTGAQPGDVLELEPGTYRENVEVPSGVTVRGRRGADRTFLRGSGRGSIVLVRAADSLVTLEGLTFIGGGTTVIRDRGIGGGGAVLADESRIRIQRCVFRSNQLQGRGDVGGAVAIFGGVSWLEDNHFEQNSAVQGGAAYVSGRAVVRGNTFAKNRASGYGGAVYVEKGRALVERNVFTDNYGGWGGGLCVGRKSEVQVRRNTLVGNRSHQWGGGMFVFKCEATVERNLLVNNSSDHRGGGFAAGRFGFPTMRNNLGWGNKPFNFEVVEDTLDIPGSREQLEVDPAIPGLRLGDLHPLAGGPCAGARGPIGALDPVPSLPPKRR